jgi:hypothetical protein
MICIRLRLLTLALAVFSGTDAPADVPVPARVQNPISIEEAWNVVRLVTTNVEQLLKEQRSTEVVDQMSLCSPALRLIARTPTPNLDQTQRDDQTMRAARSINLMARDSMAGNQAGVEAVFVEWKKCLQELGVGFDAKVLNGEVFHCVDHPDVVFLEAGNLCSECQRKLHPRRIPYSFVYVEPVSPSVKVTANLSKEIVPGKKVEGKLTMRNMKGEPIKKDDLMVTHSKEVHLIIADSELQDYQLTHASPTETAGDFTFSFTPKVSSNYRLWVAVVPCATGLQEYIRIELGNSKSETPLPAAEPSMVVNVDGYQFQLTIPKGSRSVSSGKAGEMQMIRLRVTDAQGLPVTVLEPFLNAFAHVTGIYDYQKTVFQLHPMGGDIVSDQLRGGPDLSFKFYAPRAGTVRLFSTIQVGGKSITAPFVLRVEPK